MKKFLNKIPSSQIISEAEYLSRRNFIKKAAIWTVGAALITSCTDNQTPITIPNNSSSPIEKDELGSPVTSYKDITEYTNYYEFSEDKSSPSRLAKNLKVDPWIIKVDGLVNNPKTYDVSDLKKKFEIQERIYRHRCVEGWSMVIPWLGFQLNELIKESAPTSDAKFIRFETLLDPIQMPNQSNGLYPWPYVEGLRIDEAMNDLTLLATGIYGKDLTPQNGAPIRLIVPWKYGFKSIKALVHIELVTDMPTSFWMKVVPDVYGFYSNVNPTLTYPLLPQSTERRIGETTRRKTLLFNGYSNQVSNLYQGMDLTTNF